MKWLLGLVLLAGCGAVDQNDQHLDSAIARIQRTTDCAALQNILNRAGPSINRAHGIGGEWARAQTTWVGVYVTAAEAQMDAIPCRAST